MEIESFDTFHSESKRPDRQFRAETPVPGVGFEPTRSEGTRGV